jgi:hypothetical protein
MRKSGERAGDGDGRLGLTALSLRTIGACVSAAGPSTGKELYDVQEYRDRQQDG